MGDSLILKIEKEIEKLIEEIPIPDGSSGYEVIFDGDLLQHTFPSVKVELTAERNIDESDDEGVAGPIGAFAGAYYNTISYNMTIGGESTNRDGLLNALDDLKKVFGVNYTLGNSGASAIMYRGFKFVKQEESDVLMIESYWLIRYYQSRTEPGEVAEV